MYLRTCTSGLRVESHPANCSFCCCQVEHTHLVSSSVIHTDQPRHFLLCLQVTTANWTLCMLYTVAQPFKAPGVEWMGVTTYLARLAHHSEPSREVKPSSKCRSICASLPRIWHIKCRSKTITFTRKVSYTDLPSASLNQCRPTGHVLPSTHSRGSKQKLARRGRILIKN